MARSEARITTDRSSRYLQQLCKHFAHKVPVIHIEERGQITFADGSCKLEAQDGLLILVIESEDEATVAKLEGVMSRHLERFAFRDRPTISWASLEGLKF